MWPLTVFVILIILVFALTAAAVLHLVGEAPCRDCWRTILAPVHQHLLGLMDEVVECLRHHRIEYFMCGGTLLGAVRHKGFIPWDDDSDFAIPIRLKDKTFGERWAAAIEDFKRMPEVRMRFFSTHTQVYREVDTTESSASTNSSIRTTVGRVQVDMFPMWEQADGSFRSTPWFQRFAPGEYFEASEVWPLRKYAFEDRHYLGPKKPLPFLNRSYQGWQEEGRLQWPHGFTKINDWPDWYAWLAANAMTWLYPGLRPVYKLSAAEQESIKNFDD